MLKIENLSKNFKETEVLKDCNLEIQEGSIFGLVGVNGAGKSTLLRLIAGVYQSDNGTITFNGHDTYKEPSIRKDIAFVSDEQYLPIASTINSLKLMYKSLYDFDEEAYQKYLEMFELDPKMVVTNLSKGNKRRVALLFALCIKPKLILLDEAYDGLEPLARLRFKKALADLIVEENVSVIISSHNLKELEDICDSYGILEDGKIVSYGDLLQKKELINTYQVVFNEEKEKEDFNDLDILHFQKEGRVIKLVVRGEQKEVEEKLQSLNPILLDVLPANFEELFLYELESRGKGYE